MEEQGSFFISSTQMDGLSRWPSQRGCTAAIMVRGCKRFRRRPLPYRQQAAFTISWCFWQMPAPSWKLCLTTRNHNRWTHYTQSAQQEWTRGSTVGACSLWCPWKWDCWSTCKDWGQWESTNQCTDLQGNVYRHQVIPAAEKDDHHHLNRWERVILFPV